MTQEHYDLAKWIVGVPGGLSIIFGIIMMVCMSWYDFKGKDTLSFYDSKAGRIATNCYNLSMLCLLIAVCGLLYIVIATLPMFP